MPGRVDGDGHPNERFHYMAANPPFGVEWKPEQDYVTEEHEKARFNGRFGPGLPRIDNGALLFLLHMISKMQAPPEHYTLGPIKGVKDGEGSRIAIVFNSSPLFTGDAVSGGSEVLDACNANELPFIVTSLLVSRKHDTILQVKGSTALKNIGIGE